MKIAFVSTRGIPNNYGGFEQFAEYISVGLARRGHEVTVYSPKFHPYKEDWYKGVRIKHIYSPEKWMGSSVGSFFYDFASLKDALQNEDFDIVYEAGYTSIIPAYIWFDIRKRRRPVFTTNMDGLENKRSKFGPLVRRFLDWEEKMAVKYSHYLVADNMGIHDYYKEKYGRESKFLAYGADVHGDFNPEYLEEFGLKPEEYYILVARLEPENNIVMAVEGYLRSKENGRRPLVIVGKTDTPHGRELVSRYGGADGVMFAGGIYDFKKLDSVRHFARAYFHGHSVGGTNPSLLEAMAAGCFVLAHDNMFNRAVLKGNALYYGSSEDVAGYLDNIEHIAGKYKAEYTSANIDVIRREYSWEHLIDEHEWYFCQLLRQSGV